MESVYHNVTICVNETSWAHVWRLRSHYLGRGYDRKTGGIGLFEGSNGTDSLKPRISRISKNHSV
jgi:hypothetical protein